MEVSGQLDGPATLLPSTPWTGRWMDPTRAGLDALEKRKIFWPWWESNPSSLVVQPIV